MEPNARLAALGEALRETRVARRYSQEELGLQTAVHRNYIGGIERGERSPTVATMMVLADALEIPLSELISKGEAIERR